MNTQHKEKGQIKLSPIVKAMNRQARKLQKGKVANALDALFSDTPISKFNPMLEVERAKQDSFIHFEPMSRLQASVCDVQRIERRIVAIGHSAGLAAGGKYGRVSETSIAEAKSVARATVISLFSLDGYFDVERFNEVMGMSQELRDSIKAEGMIDALSFVLRAAKRAAVESLLGDLTTGQTGDTIKLKAKVRKVLDSFMRATTEGWTNGYFDAYDSREEQDKGLSIQSFDRLEQNEETITEAKRKRALLLVLRVRKVTTKRIADMRFTKWKATGQAKLNKGLIRQMIRSSRRVARVLSMVCQGDSLQYACLTVGYDWRNYICPAFVAAYALVQKEWISEPCLLRLTRKA